jgi:hypothetical protein
MYNGFVWDFISQKLEALPFSLYSVFFKHNINVNTNCMPCKTTFLDYKKELIKVKEYFQCLLITVLARYRFQQRKNRASCKREAK